MMEDFPFTELELRAREESFYDKVNMDINVIDINQWWHSQLDGSMEPMQLWTKQPLLQPLRWKLVRACVSQSNKIMYKLTKAVQVRRIMGEN